MLARRKPGQLLREGLARMYEQVDPAAIAAGGTIPDLPAVATQYYQQIIVATKGAKLTAHEAREFKTLSVCLDLIAQGKVTEIGDIMLQRFKSLESPAPLIGAQQELVSPASASVSTLRELEVAGKQAQALQKLQKRSAGLG